MGIFKQEVILFFSQAMDIELKTFSVFTAELKSYELTPIICQYYE